MSLFLDQFISEWLERRHPMTCTCFSVDPVTFEIRYGEYTEPSWFRPDPGCPVHGCPLTPTREDC